MQTEIGMELQGYFLKYLLKTVLVGTTFQGLLVIKVRILTGIFVNKVIPKIQKVPSYATENKFESQA